MSSRLEVVVRGIGLLGPGLPNWPEGAPRLAEPANWTMAATLVPPPNRLPATERRRAGTVVKAAIVTADEACAAAGIDPRDLPSVFTSSTGEPANCHALCEALAAPERLVSPTRFTNSVHNAPGGYWHIATQSMQASTSLGAYDASFAAGLLEAAVQCHALQRAVLLVASDVPYPEPLHSKRPVLDAFSVAMVLAPGGTGPRLAVSTLGDAAASAASGGLEAVRTGIPAARALPMLEAIAAKRAGRLVIEGLPGMALAVEVLP